MTIQQSTNVKVGQDAMAFYHPGGFVSAWEQATRYAGKGGHLATLPDIAHARILSDFSEAPWDNYFTTSSAEYFGLSRQGNKILIVAHGCGPMATKDGILRAYSFQFLDETRSRKGGRISREDFLKLESGDYGDVTIVDFEEYVRMQKYPFISHLRYAECDRDPVFHARLGEHASSYLHHHAALAKKEYEKERQLEEEYGDNPVLTCISGPNNFSYLRVSDNQLEKSAVAHLLSTGRMLPTLSYDWQGKAFLAGMSTHGWRDGTRFLSLPEGTEPYPIHKAPDPNMLIHSRWRELMTPVDEPVGDMFPALIRKSGEWFTQYPTEGHSLASGEPEFHVTSAVEIGNVKYVKIRIRGYYGIFRYDPEEIKKLAPREANAFAILNTSLGADTKFHNATVQFYKVEIDTSHRIPRTEDLWNDYETMMQFIE